MNTMDELTSPQDWKKYGGIVNRSRPYACAEDLVLCLEPPTQRYLTYHDKLQGQGGSVARYIPISPDKGYHTNTDLVTNIRKQIEASPLTEKQIFSFNVTEHLLLFAEQLGLTLESDFLGKVKGNDKRNLLLVLKKILPNYIMEGEIVSIQEGYAIFNQTLQNYVDEKEKTVRCKFPQSISGNGVFTIDGSKEQNIQDFWNNTLNQGVAGPGFTEGEIIVQKHIPHIVGFYNVMTDTNKEGVSTILGAGITKQKLQGNAHVGNTTDLSVSIEGRQEEIPQTIQEEVKRIALQVSKAYYTYFGSTGLSGIDFAVSCNQGVFKVRIMEVNDRMNGCYPLHYLIDHGILPSTSSAILETISLPTNGYGKEQEKMLFRKALLYTREQNKRKSYLPLSNSGTTYQTLKISQK